MAEQINLTTPLQPPATSGYTVRSLLLDWLGEKISIVLRDNNGDDLGFDYLGDEARTLMIALNKANLTNNSLHKRVLNKLVSDGKLSGSITGSQE